MKRAIVREISPNYRSCVSSHPKHNTLNLEKARMQHEEYIKTLEELGLDVILLPSSDNYPDCCFVEDTAIIHGKRAFISRMGEKSRRGEELVIKDVLSEFFEISKCVTPGTIEGGDVIHTEKKLISGLTQRTNRDGIQQASKFLDTEIATVFDDSIVHLKSYATYIGDYNMLVVPRYSSLAVFREYKVHWVPEDELYAANTLSIDEVTLVPKGYPSTSHILKQFGREVIELDISEFEKCEGALTCLSLIF